MKLEDKLAEISAEIRHFKEKSGMNVQDALILETLALEAVILRLADAEHRITILERRLDKITPR